jgi:ribosomal protein L17
MAKPSMDDDIDLIELILIFWQHRIKFIVMGLLGLILGLSFTYSHEPVFSTDFKFSLGHPIINDSILDDSRELKSRLNDSELNKGKLPHYSFNKKTRIYTVKSNTAEIQGTVEPLIRTALANELNRIRTIAATVKGYSENQFIINADKSTIKFSNQDIANLNTDEVLDYLKISFSETESIYPHPFKHGLIGVFIGLILGFVWMILTILIGKLNLNNPKR